MANVKTGTYHREVPFQFTVADVVLLGIVVAVPVVIMWTLYRVVRIGVRAGMRDAMRDRDRRP